MIAARSEVLIPLSRAAALLGESPPTVTRWIKTGIRGIKLETTSGKSKTAVMTSVEAIGRFVKRVGVKSLLSSSFAGTR
jgi:hypothetical protein